MRRKGTAHYLLFWISLVGALTKTTAANSDVCEDESCSLSFSIDRISQRFFDDGSMVHIAFSGRNLHTFAEVASDFVPQRVESDLILKYLRQPMVQLGVLVNDNLEDGMILLPWEVLMRVGDYEDEIVLANVPSGETSVALVIMSSQDELWQIFDPVEFWVGPQEQGKCRAEHNAGIPMSGGCYPPFFQQHRPKAQIVVLGLLASPKRWEGERRLESIRITGAWVTRTCEGARVVVWLDGELVGEEEVQACVGGSLFPMLQVSLSTPVQLAEGPHNVRVRVTEWEEEELEDAVNFLVPPPPSPPPRKPGAPSSASSSSLLVQRLPWSFPGCWEAGARERGRGEENPAARRRCEYWGTQLVAAAEREAAAALNGSEAGAGCPESVFFVHIPRTGTNFITLLRNLLPACYTKHFACDDIPGSLLPASAASARSPHTDLPARAMPEHLLSCGGHLVGCAGELMHVTAGNARQRFPAHEQVTMLRDGVQRELSSFFFHQAVPGNASGFSDAYVMEFLREQDAACRLGRAWCLEQHGRNMQTKLLGGGRIQTQSAHFQSVRDAGMELACHMTCISSVATSLPSDRSPMADDTCKQ